MNNQIMVDSSMLRIMNDSKVEVSILFWHFSETEHFHKTTKWH